MVAEYRELIGSPQENIGANGFTATRQIISAWSDRWQVVLDVLGNSEFFDGTGLAQYPGEPGSLVVGVKMRPFHEDLIKDSPTDITEDLASYKNYAYIELQYDMMGDGGWPDLADGGSSEPAHQPETQLTYSSDMGLKAKVIQSRGLNWIVSSAAGKPREPVTEHDAVNVMRIPTGNHKLSWHRVLMPNMAVIRGLLGKVNQGAFIGVTDPETLLYTGWSMSREFVVPYPVFGGDKDFFQGWRVDFTFEEQRIDFAGLGEIGGWNHQYRSTPPEKAGWFRLEQAGNAVMLHELGNFAPLFFYPDRD